MWTLRNEDASIASCGLYGGRIPIRFGLLFLHVPLFLLEAAANNESFIHSLWLDALPAEHVLYSSNLGDWKQVNCVQEEIPEQNRGK